MVRSTQGFHQDVDAVIHKLVVKVVQWKCYLGLCEVYVQLDKKVGFAD